MTALRVCAVGAGYFAQFHFDAWRRIASTELCAVVDRDAQRAEATGAPAHATLAEAAEAVRPDIIDLIVQRKNKLLLQQSSTTTTTTPTPPANATVLA